VATVLVGDQEREQAANALRRHFVQGRLSTSELAARLDSALRARTRSDLAAATAGLPPAWWDVAVGVYGARWRVRRGVRRARVLFALVRAWFKVNLVLVVAAGIALAVGAPVAPTVGACLAAWALASLGFWHAWRRSP
jgi:hypothetical protein